MKLVLLTFLILALCIVLLGVKVLFIKGAKFPSGHVGSSAALRRRGIGCASGLDHGSSAPAHISSKS